MGTLFDYLDWRGDLSFDASPMNEVDSLILAQISYMDFGGIVSSDPAAPSVSLMRAIKTYLRHHKGEIPYLGRILPPQTVNLTVKAAKTKRFGSLNLSGYVNCIDDAEEMQFSAVTFLFEDKWAYLAFRGTDDTLVGWKENFNMSFMQAVPAQRGAVWYLERMAEHRRGNLFLGGHSKGGNLAVYSAVKGPAALQERIVQVFNHDGPGFSAHFADGEEYQNMRKKIHTTVPQSSVVGMLLEHEETYEVVQSSASGLLQHNAFTWDVLGNRFIHLDTVTEESRLIDSALKEWLNKMSNEERESFVDSLYETLAATGAKTLTELSMEKVKLLKVWNTLDSEARNVILKCVSLMVRSNAKAVRPSVRLTVKKKEGRGSSEK